MALDMDKLMQFVGKVVGDMGALGHAATVIIGDELGLYKAMASGPMTAEEIARKTGTDARYVQEWAAAQAASGYAQYDKTSKQFSLSEEQAVALAMEGTPAFVAGGFDTFRASIIALPQLIDAFKTGKGIGWHEHHPCLFKGVARFFRSGYEGNLVQAWIPALSGVKEKLDAGALAADVGCGQGFSTIIMAKAFPKSTFVGFDYHEASIVAARAAAVEAGVSDRVKFEVARAKDFGGKNYDLVTVFDCLHDLGDPVGAAAHIRQSLKSDGAWMIVEPFANDELEDNLNPVGRVFYSASTCLCTPASRSQEVGLCLGAQAGQRRIGEVVNKGGFTKFRRATETPFNLIYEANP